MTAVELYDLLFDGTDDREVLARRMSKVQCINFLASAIDTIRQDADDVAKELIRSGLVADATGSYLGSAQRIAAAVGFTVRIVEQDGVGMVGTADLRGDRLNVKVFGSRVVEAHIG